MRLYGERDYRPYRRTNHALSHLYHDIQCRHLEVTCAKDWVSVDGGTSIDVLANYNNINIFTGCIHLSVFFVSF